MQEEMQEKFNKNKDFSNIQFPAATTKRICARGMTCMSIIIKKLKETQNGGAAVRRGRKQNFSSGVKPFQTARKESSREQKNACSRVCLPRNDPSTVLRWP